MRFTFAIASDLHIALPHTIWDHPSRFHLVEYSIPAFEQVLAHLAQLPLDFLLLPGDLTQHGEPDNHCWLAQRLGELPYPVYVIPGNHDVPTPESLAHFAPHYTQFGLTEGKTNSGKLYYACEILPGLRLIGLNSNQFDDHGALYGAVDDEQIRWLKEILKDQNYDETIVMIHHNVLEHIHEQSQNGLGVRYMLSNSAELCGMLQAAGVKLIFTGHLHVQDIAYSADYDLYDITTGSMVSYPHPYRVLQYEGNGTAKRLAIDSFRVKTIPEQSDLLKFSREWMGDRSHPFMLRLLTKAPLFLSPESAAQLTPALRYFWADIADGDAQFSFPDFPPAVRAYFEAFSDEGPLDNQVVLEW
ncbi:MAG: metallophosphoesterase family protein [Pseudanabaenaceae cyanobacterium]|jgi:3',5'-cyclic AMP phosphodiesterase CpdA